VAVFPSVRARSGDQDGLPVALLEALAVGTPVVASDLPGLRAAVLGDGMRDTDPTGLVVEPGDVQALAVAIGALLVDAPGRVRMGEAAVRRASAYSMDAIGARYVTHLQEAVRGTSAPDEGEQR
jgi:glycosyltransferase involved in cell wall biosynthesis